MKKTVYIHIGTHKTGTTAIQKFSAENSTELLELGIDYPTISRPAINKVSSGHHLLPWYIINHPVPGNFYGEYEEKREFLFPELVLYINSSAYNHIVLSSEEFDRLSEEQIIKLKEYFTDFDIKIIVYLLIKDSYVESMYQTDVIFNNQKNNIIEYMKTMPMPLDYYKFIKRWQNAFGIENVDINFYCKKALLSENIVFDFYSKIGIDVKDIIVKDKNSNVNASLPFQYVALISMLRRMEASDEIVKIIKRLACKMGKTANKDFHFLPLVERIRLSNSGLEEIEQLNLKLPYPECFILSEDKKGKQTTNKKFSALEQVFEDFEKYWDSMEKN